MASARSMSSSESSRVWLASFLESSWVAYRFDLADVGSHLALRAVQSFERAVERAHAVS